MITLPKDELPKVPRLVCVCPACDADLIIADVDEWEINEDGSLSVSEAGLAVGCIKEPDFDGRSKAWDRFQHIHYNDLIMEDWWDAARTVHRWLTKNYRFTRTHSEEVEMLKAWNSGQARKVTP